MMLRCGFESHPHSGIKNESRFSVIALPVNLFISFLMETTTFKLVLMYFQNQFPASPKTSFGGCSTTRCHSRRRGRNRRIFALKEKAVVKTKKDYNCDAISTACRQKSSSCHFDSSIVRCAGS